MKIKPLTIIIVCMICFHLNAQVAKDSDLYKQLKIQDSTFFERSFNQCDLDYLEKAIHEDLTFYHDKGGIQNKAEFLAMTKKNLCGDLNKKPIRKVDTQSLEVFPMYNNNVLYGVVQNGTHRFYLREKNKEDVFTGTAKFTHLYLLINNKWILKEVISFNHQ